MREYTVGKKIAAIVLHQMCIIAMVIGIFAMQYCMRHKIVSELTVYSTVTVAGLAGSFIALAYLTTVTGLRNSEDTSVSYSRIDKVPSDILFLGFIIFIILIGLLVRTIRGIEFDFASLIITVATMTYLSDLVFLLFYQSIIRRVKGGILVTESIIFRLFECLARMFKGKGVATKKTIENRKIKKAIEKIAAGELDTTLQIEEFHGQEREIAEAVNKIGKGLSNAVKESIKNERMKADLITNVSHDIKTPLTSIVNYVNLLKLEKLDNERAENYIRIIDEKSQRLRQLTEDLVEASKISSGNIKLDMTQIDLVELIYQTGGEFNERFEARNLTIVTKLPSKSIFVKADGRQLYRAIENLYTNAAKYALEKTRVYVEISEENDNAVFCIKNVSENLLQFKEGGSANDLTERFVRGEVSRTTEGSGLGLSITKNLTNLMGGTFDIKVDGDLFIATISFKMV